MDACHGNQRQAGLRRRPALRRPALPSLALAAWALCLGCQKPQPAPPSPPAANSPETKATSEKQAGPLANVAPPARLQLIRPDDRKTVKALLQRDAVLQRNAEGNVVAVILSAAATDEDLVLVAQLTRVRSVNFGGAKTTARGISQLAALPELQTLLASRTRCDDRVLADLADKKMIELALSGAPVSDAGLAPLAGQAELTRLDLSWTKISAAGLAHLRGLSKLQSLNLSFTEIDDQAVTALASLKQLKSLNLEGIDMSLASLQSLQAELPETRIHNAALDKIPDKKPEPKPTPEGDPNIT